MGPPKQRLLRLTFGALCAAWACMAFAPVADAQFFWWFDQPKSAPKPRAKTQASRRRLPPIVPRESSAPPPPDDRPYDNKLMRLAEILGAVHYLRELCGAQEGQVWRDQMKEILRNEGTTAVRRANWSTASTMAIAVTGAPTGPAPSRPRLPPSASAAKGRPSPPRSRKAQPSQAKARQTPSLTLVAGRQQEDSCADRG